MFGCITFVHDHSKTNSKLDPKAIKYVFLQYFLTQKGFKYYDPTTNRTFVSLDVTFFENIPFYSKSFRGENNIKEDKKFDTSGFSLTFDLTPPYPPSPITHDQSNNPNKESEPNIPSYTTLQHTESNLNSGGKKNNKEILLT